MKIEKFLEKRSTFDESSPNLLQKYIKVLEKDSRIWKEIEIPEKMSFFKGYQRIILREEINLQLFRSKSWKPRVALTCSRASRTTLKCRASSEGRSTRRSLIR